MDQDIILKTDRAGRVHTPRERQEQIVAEWKNSGVSAMRFAEAIGVKYQTLAGWIRKHGGRADNGTAGDAPRWLEMAVAPQPPAGGNGLRIERKRQSWHLRIALVPPMDLGLSATDEVLAVSGIFA